MMDPRALFGTDEPPAPFRILTAGPLTARFEAGALRHICWHGTEVLRGIAWLVRDRDWGTLRPAISDLRLEETGDSFTITYRADYLSGDARLPTEVSLSATADGHLTMQGHAMPEADFETNRTGFTVLHPIEGVAGQWVRVAHGDGTVEETTFPDLIAPWQPFRSIAAITHRAAGAEVTCRFHGDDFEMEDQRNWSDASYKTYVRPLALPWPYLLPADAAVVQRVELSIAPAPVTATEPQPARSGGRMPEIGFVIAPEEVAEALRHIARLGEVAPQRILCHFDPVAGHGPAAIRAFAALQQAFRAAYDLECVVAASGDLAGEMQGVAAMVAAAGLDLASIAICPSVDRQSTPPGSVWPDCPPLEAIYAATRAAFPGVPLGGGMFSYFTELNRKRPPVALLDYVTHGTNPIVHAADDLSVMETLEAVPHILRSARAIIGAGQHRLGPTMLGMRQNPYGSRTIPNPAGGRVCMTDDDPRQRGQFAAAFTAGYAVAQAGMGVAVWVPAAFTGPRGVLDAAGGLLPVGRVVAELARMAGQEVTQAGRSTGRAQLRLADGTGFDANLTGEAQAGLAAYQVHFL